MTSQHPRRSFPLLIAYILIVLIPAPATYSATADESISITRHQIETDHKPLAYTAETGRIAIRDVETGEPHGHMFYIAYRVPSPDKLRPVTFVWNGGPGANSATLHFEVVGPKRAEGARLVDNAETWLTETDLVFVDPIGCGFSRPERAEYAAEFYGTVGDTASVTEFIRSWRLLHDADDAPLILVGESWGAPRAATVAYALERRGVRVNGLVLISGGTAINKDYGPLELLRALHVADLSVTALYHSRLAPALGNDLDAIRKAAVAWVRGIYAPALARVESLSDAERDAVIEQLARFTGLPAGRIDRKTLDITPRQFRTSLLEDQGKELQTFDMRQAVRAGTDPAVVEYRAGAAILRYLRRDLGYRTDLPYVGLEPVEQGYAPSGEYPKGVNERWNYATAEVSPEILKASIEEAAKRGSGPPRIGPPLPATEEVVALNPRLKVLVASGIYDSYSICAAYKELPQHLPPALRLAITFKSYVGGHMMYLDPPTRLRFSQDVKEMISAIRQEAGVRNGHQGE